MTLETLETLRLERRECFDPESLPLGMVSLYEDGEWLGLVTCRVEARTVIDPSPNAYRARLLIGGEWWTYKEGIGLAPGEFF